MQNIMMGNLKRLYKLESMHLIGNVIHHGMPKNMPAAGKHHCIAPPIC